MNYWVREVPPGAKVGEADHYRLLGGDQHCNQIQDPMQFPTWEMAQAMANALTANPPTDEQRKVHSGFVRSKA